MQTAAIYGFQFTQPFVANGVTFVPIESEHTAAKALAHDLGGHKLTGTVSAPHFPRLKLFHLEGVLSFIEHLEVLVSDPVDDDAAVHDPKRSFPEKAAPRPRHQGGGAVVGPDAFNPWRDSRRQFIDLALRHLDDDNFCERTRFNSLLLKCVETFRQRQPFLEITYFLLISGLEAHCRAMQKDHHNPAAQPMARALKSYGFNVYQDQPNDLPRSMQTYLHIRNALFHHGDFSKTVPINNSSVTLNCIDYLFNLSMLVSLTVMKAIGFDDGHMNWDCWIDRQPWR